MRIGIDIDDTITDSTKTVKKYIKKYDSYYSKDHKLINGLESIIRGFFDVEEARLFFKDHCMEIGNEIKVKKNAKEVIDKLMRDGHEIVIITARSDKYYKDSDKYCADYLKRNNINYDKLVTKQTYKIETCKREKIDLMIDDAIDTVENLEKEGIKSVLFTSELNKDKKTKVKRVNNWNQLYDYIKEIA